MISQVSFEKNLKNPGRKFHFHNLNINRDINVQKIKVKENLFLIHKFFNYQYIKMKHISSNRQNIIHPNMYNMPLQLSSL